MTEKTGGGPDDDEPEPPATDEPDYARYGEVKLGNGQLLMYDVDVREAWIQSDISLSLAEST